MSNWTYPHPPTENDDVAIVAIIDASGSMYNLTDDTIGGFNSFKGEQTALPGKAYMSVTLFNTEATILYSSRDIKEIPDLTRKTYIACGGTALYDAVGKTILDVSKSPNLPKKVLVLIITDGEENSSREYRQSVVKSLIEEKTTNGWQFVFLGANIDKWSAESIGIKNFGSYVSNEWGTANLYKTVSANASVFRSAGFSAVNTNSLNWNSTDQVNNTPPGSIPVVDKIINP